MSDTPEPAGRVVSSFDWEKGPQYASPDTGSMARSGPTPTAAPPLLETVEVPQDIAASWDVSTEPPDDTAIAEAEAEAEAQEKDELLPNEVRLREGPFAGQIVRLKKTNGGHDNRVDLLFAQAGYPMTSAGMVIYIRTHAVCAIQDRGNYYTDEATGERKFRATKTYMLPRSPSLLDMLTQEFETPDLNAIIAAYTDMTGGGQNRKAF